MRPSAIASPTASKATSTAHLLSGSQPSISHLTTSQKRPESSSLSTLHIGTQTSDPPDRTPASRGSPRRARPHLARNIMPLKPAARSPHGSPPSPPPSRSRDTRRWAGWGRPAGRPIPPAGRGGGLWAQQSGCLTVGMLCSLYQLTVISGFGFWLEISRKK